MADQKGVENKWQKGRRVKDRDRDGETVEAHAERMRKRERLEVNERKFEKNKKKEKKSERMSVRNSEGMTKAVFDDQQEVTLEDGDRGS